MKGRKERERASPLWIWSEEREWKTLEGQSLFLRDRALVKRQIIGPSSASSVFRRSTTFSSPGEAVVPVVGGVHQGTLSPSLFVHCYVLRIPITDRFNFLEEFLLKVETLSKILLQVFEIYIIILYFSILEIR